MSIQRDTDKDWKKVAEDNPYWAVLSHEAYQKEQIDALRIEQFMASGEEFVANLFALVGKHFVPNFAPKRVLDFGCGVGRLVIPFARRVSEAVGVDVAPAMLTLCQQHAKQAELSNLSLYKSDDFLTEVVGGFDLVNTYIVLQHIPPDRGYKIIQAMLDRLLIGGIGSIQLTYAKSRKFLAHEQPKALYYRREGGTLVDLVDSGWSPPEGTINMFDYDLNYVMAQLTQVCGSPVLMLPTNDDSHLGGHFVFQKVR